MPAARLAAGTPGDADLVSVGIALADVAGIAALTLRTVAHRAGVPLAQARRAYGSRDRLVAALVQRALAPRRAVAPREHAEAHVEAHTQARPEAHPQATPDAETPADVLVRLAEQEWVAYREPPWLVTVLASSRPPLVPAVLDAARAGTEAFERLGADPPSALGRYLALSGYVQGMALLLLAEHDESSRSGTDYRAWWAAEARRLERTGARRRHPWLDVVSEGRVPESFDADAEAWFRAGLTRVLAGLIAT
ncbi:hypothetical protein [Promicromonospora sp. NPDC050262]|uniref:hypothetical protein n=1 Tax=Promicromonospora sp. NPDC050262 TaxID=3155036 RepID=UPI0033E87B5B